MWVTFSFFFFFLFFTSTLCVLVVNLFNLICLFYILSPYHVWLCVGLKPICGQLSRICATRRWWQFWAHCCVLAGFGQDWLQPVCGWHAQSLARLLGGHRVQTMTNPDPNQADQMGPSDWLRRQAGQHFSRGNNKYTAMAMWLLCNFFCIIYCRYYTHNGNNHTQGIKMNLFLPLRISAALNNQYHHCFYRYPVNNCLRSLFLHILYLMILPECAIDE